MTTERNDGKPLEQLVKLVEGMSLPPGFKIETNVKEYNEDGKQLAELDIVVSGMVGTVAYRTLFECRDRNTPGDGAWILSLIGRREALGFSEVIAVSTSGFSPAAIEFAEKHKIPLRSVESLTADDIRGFLPMTAPLVFTNGHADHIHLSVLPEGVLVGEGDQLELLRSQQFSTIENTIVELATNKSYSVSQIWDWVVKKHPRGMFDDVAIDGAPVSKTIEIPADVLSPFRVLVDGERFQIAKMTVQATLRCFTSKMPLQFAVHYGHESPRPTVVAKWTGDEEGIKEIMVILQKEKRVPH